MCAATKKLSTKAAEPGPGVKSVPEATVSKSHHTTHPPWIDMITECITTTPDGTRHGVSRPAIKKFVDSKYHLETNPLVSSQLNRAIHHGADKGKFVLPKGPSGKVKLAPRGHEAAKENAKPSSKRSAAAKESHVIPIKAATKTAVKKTSRAAKPAATTVPATPPKSRIAEKKYHSTAKKARTTGSSTRRTVGRKAATAQGKAKKTATGRSTPSKTGRRGATSSKRTTRAAASKQRAQKTSRK
ncbi:hypothetical protein DFJ58DRAFT_752039 [Suillus subalutaceus]|uniref:uncharacterized protein n=1 Tax=Suillus subalutaceus TaxID=48586 RepID=UPI001B85EE4A|nr:uncharacterized protein DFJ58DRAFT_752039 [Suillus subalutaceus]KAG1877628.1 hypothetical protein DFJ58DRAFT_752039 [Suillus subalutaceus]